MYGMSSWRDLFSPRQLLCHGVSVEVFRELLSEQRQRAILRSEQGGVWVLAFALDKLRRLQLAQHVGSCSGEVMANTFRPPRLRVLKWSYAEMAPLIEGLGYDWAIEQTAKCIEELVELTCGLTAPQAIPGSPTEIATAFTPPP